MQTSYLPNNIANNVLKVLLHIAAPSFMAVPPIRAKPGLLELA